MIPDDNLSSDMMTSGNHVLSLYDKLSQTMEPNSTHDKLSHLRIYFLSVCVLCVLCACMCLFSFTFPFLSFVFSFLLNKLEWIDKFKEVKQVELRKTSSHNHPTHYNLSQLWISSDDL